METSKAAETVFKYNPADSDPWNAYRDAENWANAQDYSVGPMESGSPTAIFKGICDISKWRNLSQQERDECDGVIVAANGSRFRESDVVVRMKPAAPPEPKNPGATHD